MSGLKSSVVIDRRFARSARIDSDLNGSPPLVGYVLQASIAKSFAALGEAQRENRQGAYTWTGPYGGGKSSAALLLANLVAGDALSHVTARNIVGDRLSALFAEAFPNTGGPWRLVAVTGRRMRLRDALIEAASTALGWSDDDVARASGDDEALITALVAGGVDSSGTLLILDELGKLLEHEALEDGDVHLLQDLAERASRSEGRLVVIGILHQSFDQYAARASRNARAEWAKVQGRYQDIAFLSGADETIALLGRAITATVPRYARERAMEVAEAVAKRRPIDTVMLAEALSETWPLNPVTALLLGPVSRARFAQNERSVFGFLSSAEPAGFQDFLETAEGAEPSYDPARLWDYLAVNFGMAFASGAESNRFSLACEAIERAAAKGSAVHVALTKSAAVIEFFRSGSGVTLADDFLRAAVPGATEAAVAAAICDLLEWAVLIKQPRLGGYALFAGSDFDLEEALKRSILPIDNMQVEGIGERIGFGFASAKRHYFERGALRIFEIAMQVVGEDDNAQSVSARIGARTQRGSGLLILLLGDGTVKPRMVDSIAQRSARILQKEGRMVAIAGTSDSFTLRNVAAELLAVERVLRDHPQIEGDRIARREVAARQAQCIDDLHRAVAGALGGAEWYLAPLPETAHSGSLTTIASALADIGYAKSPIIKSELLQRDKPSSNSMAALRELLHAMVRGGGHEQLGITQYPAELGLYLTILKPFGLHRKLAEGLFGFAEPDESPQGRSLQPAWQVIDEISDENLSRVYERWAAPPYGIKAGIMPVIALAYMLAKRDSVAIYIDGIFQPAIDDVVVDRLLQKPELFRLRRIDRSVRETAFLSGLAQVLNVENDGSSLPVAAALFQRFEALPSFSKRTARLPDEARAIRGVILKAEDPERLLFDDLPATLGERLTPGAIEATIVECEQSYPALLAELRVALARALGVETLSFGGIAGRTANIKGLTNDYNFEAFADRAAALEQGTGDIESLVSLLLHRPARNWSDRDREEALTEIARYGRRFRELEALSVVRNRRANTEALALVVGLDPSIPPIVRSFVLSDREKTQAAGLADRLVETLRTDDSDGRLSLAALARAVAVFAAEADEEVAA